MPPEPQSELREQGCWQTVLMQTSSASQSTEVVQRCASRGRSRQEPERQVSSLLQSVSV
ncbi:hypothetical protein ACLESD_30520 [Pyxidicoccus sp. 3LFB2]